MPQKGHCAWHAHSRRALPLRIDYQRTSSSGERAGSRVGFAAASASAAASTPLSAYIAARSAARSSVAQPRGVRALQRWYDTLLNTAQPGEAQGKPFWWSPPNENSCKSISDCFSQAPCKQKHSASVAVAHNLVVRQRCASSPAGSGTTASLQGPAQTHSMSPLASALPCRWPQGASSQLALTELALTGLCTRRLRVGSLPV